jgi:hypothetical protein
MLNSGPHESFDAAQMSAADHAALRARLRDCREIGGARPEEVFSGLYSR